MIGSSKTLRPLEKGRLMALTLKGAWRASPPPFASPVDQLPAVADALHRRGAGALVWWKLSRHIPEHIPSEQFQESYRSNLLHAFMQERVLEKTISTLNRHGVEPLLVKGLVVARVYPDLGLRPCGDIDLQIDPAHLAACLKGLREVPEAATWVDLHQGVPDLPDRDYKELVRRSQRIRVGEVSLRVLGVEDQLRLLCLHFARHGGWRPLWLCDIGAFLEALPDGFDWDYFWSGDPCLSTWGRAVLDLAVELLDVRVGATGRFARSAKTDWLQEVVLTEWGSENPGDSHSRDSKSMATHFLSPTTISTGLCCRIPNAMEAAFKRGHFPANGRMRAWHQVVYSLGRAARFMLRLPSLLLHRDRMSLPCQIHVQ